MSLTEYPRVESATVLVASSSSGQDKVVLWFAIALVGLGFLAVLIHRITIQRRSADPAKTSMTRPVLAVLLVGAVIVLAAASLSIADTSTRNLLIGGIVSLSSAAAAYYFASSGATEARHDLLQATSAVQAPQLVGKTIYEAQILMSGLSVAMELPTPRPDPSEEIIKQNPPAGTTISHHDRIQVATEPPRSFLRFWKK